MESQEEEYEIAYKVVSSKTRLGTNAMIYGEHIILNEIPNKLKKFFPVYEKGAVIKAPTRTGILCFDSTYFAKRWTDSVYSLGNKDYIIIAIKGYNRVKNPKIKIGCGGDIDLLIHKLNDNDYYCGCIDRQREFLSHLRAYARVEVLG